MGLGETIGFAARVTQNNGGSLYSANYGTNWVHIALMGDPTLRLHPVAPPAALVASSNPTAGIDLAWTPSPDTVTGYHVYRSASTRRPVHAAHREPADRLLLHRLRRHGRLRLYGPRG